MLLDIAHLPCTVLAPLTDTFVTICIFMVKFAPFVIVVGDLPLQLWLVISLCNCGAVAFRFIFHSLFCDHISLFTAKYLFVPFFYIILFSDCFDVVII